MLSIVGWHDNFLKSHFDLYHALAPNAPHRLVCGPWEHTNYVSPFSTSRTGAIEFGPDATCGVSLSTPLCLDWFDRWLKGEDAGAAGRRALLAATATTSGARRPLASAPHGAALVPALRRPRQHARRRRAPLADCPPGDEPPDSFLYDPLDPVPTVGGKLLMPTIMMAGIEDQTEVEEREDVLVYTSPLLVEPVEVNGRIRVELWAASSAVDTDFTAKLCDVGPDGFSSNLSPTGSSGRATASRRASARRSSGRASRRASTIDLWDLAHTFLPGPPDPRSRSARATSRASTATRTPGTSSARTARRT